jgi:hypothetical protein
MCGLLLEMKALLGIRNEQQDCGQANFSDYRAMNEFKEERLWPLILCARTFTSTVLRHAVIVAGT